MDLDVKSMCAYYPMFVNIKDKRVAVIGGGRVAERKIQSLLSTGAVLVVVSPNVTEQIKLWAEVESIKWEKMRYNVTHLEGVDLVFAATDKTEVNLQIYQDAKALNRWVNMAEHPELSSFIVPSTIQRGRLLIAVSTSGASPSTARKIKAELEEAYGEEYEVFLDVLEELRFKVKQHIKDKDVRQRLFKELAAIDWMEVIQTHQLETVKGTIEKEIKELIGLGGFKK
jgi:precorrin-2 dehydrogenase/sirohydrochlorin ferrochelatase